MVGAIIRGKCPICARVSSASSLDDLPYFPFCSERCRLIDLGKWVEGSYVISGSPLTNLSHEESDEEVDNEG